MHEWVGDGGCTFYNLPQPVMYITASDVTVKNFGFKNASQGIKIFEDLKNVTIDNVEGHTCTVGIVLPRTSYALKILNSNFVGSDAAK